ncbi:MAG: hypothetical protein JW699_02850 [Chitinispirillaceae bacterium]|nr:hypothetical protein [Chitinispirillaceae bacterium]
MSFFTGENAQALMSAAYVLCSVALNGIALLISLFYRKKFRHASPRWGFIAAIVFFLFYSALLMTGADRSALFHGVAHAFLACGSLASIVCTVDLFLIMQRVRK